MQNALFLELCAEIQAVVLFACFWNTHGIPCIRLDFITKLNPARTEVFRIDTGDEKRAHIFSVYIYEPIYSHLILRADFAFDMKRNFRVCSL